MRPSDSWHLLATIAESEPRGKSPKKRASPPAQAAEAMDGDRDARMMIWRILDGEDGPRAKEFIRRLLAAGWTRAKVGVYELLWNTDEWRPVSVPKGSGVGRSIESLFSLFEPMSKEAQKIYGWRGRGDTDRPSDDFIGWAQKTLPQMQKFARALPEYVDIKIEPVSAWGSNPSALVRGAASPTAQASPPVIWFDRDGKVWLFVGESIGRDGNPVAGSPAKMSGRLTVDPGHLSTGVDDTDEEDWITAGERPRLRGPHRVLSRVGGKVKGDGSITRMLRELSSQGAQTVRLASGATSPGESKVPRNRLPDVPDGERMAATWATSQTPLPPGVWKVDDLRKTLRMIARETGEEL